MSHKRGGGVERLKKKDCGRKEKEREEGMV